MEERPSNFRRLLACILDWYICSVLIAIPHNIMSTKMTDIYKASIIIAYSAIAITFVYYALIPYITKGQTIGKKLLKLRVVKMNGQQINLKNIFFREIIGVFLIEGSIFAGSNYFRELIQLYTNSNLLVPLSIASSVITIMSIGYSQFNKERIMFHDLIGGTKVIKSN